MNRKYLNELTQKWYLADHPKPGALALAPNPLLMLKEQSLYHEYNRLEAVAEMIGMVGIMTARGVLSGNEVITVDGAIFQYAPGDRATRVVAAHCLPGHPRFAGHLLHTADDWKPNLLEKYKVKPLPLAAKLRGVFGRTDFVDETVNQSDSLIEKMAGGRGIKPSLGNCLYRLQQNLKYRRARDWATIGELAAQALQDYRIHASYACEERLDYLQRNFAHDSTANKKSHVLEVYLQTVQNNHITPDAAEPCGFQELVSEVVARSDEGGVAQPL